MSADRHGGERQLMIRSFRAIGTTATVVVQDAAVADKAARILAADLEEIDLACSRFRPDSELQTVHAHAGARGGDRSRGTIPGAS